MSSTPTDRKFKHDATFWSVALQSAVFGFFMGGFGPAQPLLQSDQGTSGAIAGLHGTSLGLASILAGLLNARVVHKFGRFKTSWIGIGIFGVGAMMFILAPSPFISISASAIIGIGVSLTINSGFALLTNHYTNHQTRAASQANGVNSLFVVFGTLLIGALAGTSINWRFGLLLIFPAGAALYLFARKHNSEEHIPELSGRQSGKLSGKYWIGWIAITLCISSEFAMTFWSASLFRDRTDYSAATATVAVLAGSLGMALGRWFGPLIMTHIDLDQRLIFLLVFQLSGFMVFWYSHDALFSFFGLLISGLGISMQFTLNSLRLIRLSEKRPDLAMGIGALGAGSAIAVAPLLLGFLADQIGISKGYLMVPIIVLIAIVLVLVTPTKELD